MPVDLSRKLVAPFATLEDFSKADAGVEVAPPAPASKLSTTSRDAYVTADKSKVSNQPET
jgi:hypothetical protein